MLDFMHLTYQMRLQKVFCRQF